MKSPTDQTTAPDIRNLSDGVTTLGNFLPPLVIILLLLGFAVTPVSTDEPQPAWHYFFAHWLHHIGFGLLFFFLVAAQYLQIEGKIRMAMGATLGSIERTYYRLWFLTKLVPAPAALLIFLTGLRMMYETGYSLSSGWLFWLVAAFGFMFWDGLLFFTRDTRQMKDEAIQGLIAKVTIAEFSRRFRNPFRDTVLFIHFASFPFVFLLGALRPECKQPFESEMRMLDEMFAQLHLTCFSSNIAHICTAIVVWASMLIFVLILRLVMGACSRVFKRYLVFPRISYPLSSSTGQ